MNYSDKPNASLDPVDEQVFRSIVGMQYDTNTKMAGSDWLTNPLKYNYRAAEAEERFELLVAAGWKPFWKKGPEPQLDLENCQMELVDILHFRLSSMMQDLYLEALENMENMGIDLRTSVVDLSVHEWEYSSREYYDLCFGGLGLRSPGSYVPGSTPTQTEYLEIATTLGYMTGTYLDDLLFVSNYFGLSEPMFYAMYVAKNALNHFRTNNGYKDGIYQKIWADSREDNYYVMQYVKALIKEGRTAEYQDIYDKIAELYIFYTGAVGTDD